MRHAINLCAGECSGNLGPYGDMMRWTSGWCLVGHHNAARRLVLGM